MADRSAAPVMVRRETPPGTRSTLADSTPSTAEIERCTFATQLAQVSPSTPYALPVSEGGAEMVSFEQQPQPDEEDAKGSSVRDGVCMSVPFIAEDAMGAVVERL